MSPRKGAVEALEWRRTANRHVANHRKLFRLVRYSFLGCRSSSRPSRACPAAPRPFFFFFFFFFFFLFRVGPSAFGRRSAFALLLPARARRCAGATSRHVIRWEWQHHGFAVAAAARGRGVRSRHSAPGVCSALGLAFGKGRARGSARGPRCCACRGRCSARGGEFKIAGRRFLRRGCQCGSCCTRGACACGELACGASAAAVADAICAHARRICAAFAVSSLSCALILYPPQLNATAYSLSAQLSSCKTEQARAHLHGRRL